MKISYRKSSGAWTGFESMHCKKLLMPVNYLMKPQAAVSMLLTKAEIYLNGVTKRGKTDEAHYYQQLIKRYQEAVRE